jgi:hypothetical protein
MSSTRIDELIINFNENNYKNIDSMVNDLNCIITEAANMSLKLKSPRKIRNSKILNKKRQPKWFDSSLFNLRRRLDDQEKLLKQYSTTLLPLGVKQVNSPMKSPEIRPFNILKPV